LEDIGHVLLAEDVLVTSLRDLFPLRYLPRIYVLRFHVPPLWGCGF
jgi:hypothetical protein